MTVHVRRDHACPATATLYDNANADGRLNLRTKSGRDAVRAVRNALPLADNGIDLGTVSDGRCTTRAAAQTAGTSECMLRRYARFAELLVRRRVADPKFLSDGRASVAWRQRYEQEDDREALPLQLHGPCTSSGLKAFVTRTVRVRVRDKRRRDGRAATAGAAGADASASDPEAMEVDDGDGGEDNSEVNTRMDDADSDQEGDEKTSWRATTRRRRRHGILR